MRVLAWTGAIAGVTLSLREAFSSAVSFEQAMFKVQTLNPNTNAMGLYGAQLQEISSQYGISADELAEALYQAQSAGVPLEQSLRFMDSAAKAAVAGFTDVGTVVDGVTGVINAYGMSAADVNKVTDTLFATVNLGKTSMGELGKDLGKVLSTAGSLKIPFNEINAIIATTTAQAKNTSESMTGLQAVLSAIIKPSGEATKLAQSMGIEFNVAAMRSKGLAGFLSSVAEAAENDSQKLATLFGSVEALGVVMALTSEDGGAIFQRNLEGIGTAAGTTDKQFATASKSMAFRLGQIKQGFAQMGREVGFVILRELAPSAKSVPEMIEKAIPRVKRAVEDGIRFIRQNLGYLVDILESYLIFKGLGLVSKFAAGVSNSLGGAFQNSSLGNFGISDDGLSQKSKGATGSRAGAFLGRVAQVTIAAQAAYIGGVAIGEFFARQSMSQDLANRTSERDRTAASVITKSVLGRGRSEDLASALTSAWMAGSIGKSDGGAGVRSFLDTARGDFNSQALFRLLDTRSKSDPAFAGRWSGIQNFSQDDLKQFFGDRMVKAMASAQGANDAYVSRYGRDTRYSRESAVLGAIEEYFGDRTNLENDLISYLENRQKDRQKEYERVVSTLQEIGESTVGALQGALESWSFGKAIMDYFAAKKDKPNDININHLITDKNKCRGHAIRRAARGDGTARHLNPRYRMMVLRGGAAAGIVQPLEENYHNPHLLNGGG